MSENDGQRRTAESKSLASMVDEIIDIQEMMDSVLEENRKKHIIVEEEHQEDQFDKNAKIEDLASNFLDEPNDAKCMRSIAKPKNQEEKYDVTSTNSLTKNSHRDQGDIKSIASVSSTHGNRKSPSIKEMDTKSMQSNRSARKSQDEKLIDEDQKSIGQSISVLGRKCWDVDDSMLPKNTIILKRIDDLELDTNYYSVEDQTHDGAPLKHEENASVFFPSLSLFFRLSCIFIFDVENVDGLKSGEDKLGEAIRKATVRKSPKMVDKNKMTTPEVKKRDRILSSSMNIFNKVMKRKPKKKDYTKRPGFITELATNPTVLAGAVVKKSTKPRVASGTLRRRTMKVPASTTRKTSPKISIQRPLSAANDLALLKRKMAEMIKENRLLRQIQHRQEMCMRKMEVRSASSVSNVSQM
uniref:Uncharacterized protein n=1 Tax=Romanomermis culicivorax TaxID=13658 RepID=A0A915L3Z4_ROMCU